MPTSEPLSRRYELLPAQPSIQGPFMHQIRALIDNPIHNVKAGDLGGYIQSEANLDQNGHAWIANGANVLDNALVTDSALVTGHTKLSEFARVGGHAVVGNQVAVCGHAVITDHAHIHGHGRGLSIQIKDDAMIRGAAIITGNAHIDGHAIIDGQAHITDLAHICGHAIIDGQAVIKDHARAWGEAHITNTTLLQHNASQSGPPQPIGYPTIDPETYAVAQQLALNALHAGPQRVDDPWNFVWADETTRPSDGTTVRVVGLPDINQKGASDPPDWSVEFQTAAGVLTRADGIDLSANFGDWSLQDNRQLDADAHIALAATIRNRPVAVIPPADSNHTCAFVDSQFRVTPTNSERSPSPTPVSRRHQLIAAAANKFGFKNSTDATRGTLTTANSPTGARPAWYEQAYPSPTPKLNNSPSTKPTANPAPGAAVARAKPKPPQASQGR